MTNITKNTSTTQSTNINDSEKIVTGQGPKPATTSTDKDTFTQDTGSTSNYQPSLNQWLLQPASPQRNNDAVDSRHTESSKQIERSKLLRFIDEPLKPIVDDDEDARNPIADMGDATEKRLYDIADAAKKFIGIVRKEGCDEREIEEIIQHAEQGMQKKWQECLDRIQFTDKSEKYSLDLRIQKHYKRCMEELKLQKGQFVGFYVEQG